MDKTIDLGKAAKEAEVKKRVDAFLADYKALNEKHHLSFVPILNFKPTGIEPVLDIIDLKK